MHYVYILSRPCGEPFYVGKGSGKRVFKHLDEAAKGVDYNPYKNRIIRKINANGLKIMTVVVGWFNEPQDAFHFERNLIRSIGRVDLGTGPLANLCDGGYGVLGVVITPKIRDIRRRAAIKRYSDPEQRAWAADNMRANCHNPEATERRVAAQIEAQNTEEHLARVSSTSRKKWSDPSYREAVSQGHQKYWQSNEAHQKRSAVASEMWSRPDYKGNGKSVVVDGIEYETMKEAADALDLKLATLSARFRRYAKKGKFPHGWGYLEKAA